MVNVSIEELVVLKEQGMTDKKIAEYLSENGTKISMLVVRNKLNKYYQSIGRAKPRGRNIQDEELAVLKEQKKTDREIAEYFTKQGRKICLGSVNTRLTKHYRSKKIVKPKSKKNYIVKKEIKNEEILELRQKGMTLRQIAEYLKSLGKNISHAAINNRIKRNELELKESQASNEIKKQEFKESLKVTNVTTPKEDKTNNVVNFARQENER